MIVAGVDEAGRGPVIGPMIMAICSIDEKNVHLLDELGVKDSKLIAPQKREFLFDKIKELCEYQIIVLPPSIIDDALNDASVNLNRLEGKTTALLVNGINANKYVIDCPSINISAYTQFLYTLIDKKKKLIVEHRADANNTIVGAASILAKVTRDRIIEDLKREIGHDFGSGYPSDPKTVLFINEYYDKYDCFRKSWATYKNVVEGKKQKKINCY